MLVDLINELPREIKDTAIYMPKLSIDSGDVSRLLRDCDDFEELLPIINKINNQGIISIGPISKVGKVYNRAGCILDFSCFARAELLFLVTYAAIKTGTRIILQYDFKQIEPEVLRVYFSSFSKMDSSDNVSIIADTYYYRNWLLKLM